MADTGWVSPGTVVNDDSVGDREWSDLDYVKANGGGYASVDLAYEYFYIYDNEVKIVKSNGNIGTENKANIEINWEVNSFSYITYGGSSDLWEEAWSVSDINDSDFGVVISAISYFTSYYIKATNFSFSIPSGATINGIEARINKGRDNLGGIDKAYIDHIQIKVYYTTGTDTNSEILAKTTGSQTSNDELSGFLAGGHGRYKENFSTTTKKDGATTASWTGDGSAEML